MTEYITTIPSVYGNFQVRTKGRIPFTLIKDVCDLLWNTPIYSDHEVTVTIVQGSEVKIGDEYGYGLFHECDRSIHICSGTFLKNMLDRRQFVLETLLHELIHYEQFKEGRKLTDRGVERRAYSLYRKLSKKLNLPYRKYNEAA